MSKVYIPVEVEKAVALRAKGICEYCLAPEEYSLLSPYHIDHIIALSHGGENISDNMALACPICNNRKGANLATYLPESNQVIRLYHPRQDVWKDHFVLRDTGEIIPQSDVAQGTIRLLRLNGEETVELRRVLRLIGYM